MGTLHYRATFERIGRSRDVAPLEIETPDDETVATVIAEKVFHYARGFLGSRDVDVVAELDSEEPGAGGSGTIFVGGFRAVGQFRIEAVTSATTTT